MPSQSFLRHAAVYGLGTILIHAAGFFLLPVYTQYLSPTEYGILEVLNRFAEVLVICLLFGGIRQAALAFHGQSSDDAERQATVAAVLALLAGITAGGLGLVIATSETGSGWLGIDNTGLLELAILSALLEASMMVLLSICQARQESGIYVVITVSHFLLRATLIILTVVTLGWGIRGVLLGSAGVSGLYVILLGGREVLHGAWRPDWLQLRSIVAFALPLLPGGIGFFVLNNGDRFFLLRHVGEETVGIYALGYKLALVVSLLGKTPLAMVWSVRMYAAARQADASVVFGRFFTRLLGMYVLIGLGLCLFQDEVVGLLAGPRYAGAALVIAPIVLAYLFLTAADLMDSGFYVRRRTIHKTWIVLISTSGMLLFYAWLIPLAGSTGAALATLAGFALHAGLTCWMSQRVFPVRYEPGRLVVMVGLAASLWLVSRGLPAESWTIPVKLGLWALWPVCLWCFGLVSREEKHRAKAVVAGGLARVKPLLPMWLFGGVR